MKIKDISVLKEQLEQASQNVIVDSVTKKSLGDSRVRDYEERVISEWKKEKVRAVRIAEFDTAKDLIKVTLKEFSNATILEGEGGLGKTFLTIETVKEELEPDEWNFKSGYTSPLAFYKYLYKNRNKKALVLDDLDGLFGNETSVSIFKRATDNTTGKRLIFYDTTSKKAEDTPSVFELKARLIILCNEIPNKYKRNTSALLSRTIHYEVEFSHPQKKKIIKMIVKSRKDLTKEQKEKTLDIIEKETSVVTKNFSIRTMEKLIAYIKYGQEKAADLFRKTTQTDEVKEAVLELMKSDLNIERQADGFHRTTGRSRSTFFRIKKRLIKESMESVKVSPKKDMTHDTTEIRPMEA